ncbi:MAG: hypothetical protein EZS28_030280, partial [Streblomastix strix]
MDELEGGAQGRKYFVKLKETGVHFAMNSIQYLKQTNKERAEKEIAEMKKLESKFNVRLVYTIQDHTDMYMVMEYCENGDLLKVISELQQVHEQERITLVWGIFGQMIRALDFLHCNGVIHQDNKPAVYMSAEVLMFKRSPLPQRAHPRRQNRIRELPEEDGPLRNQKRHSQITTGIGRKIKKRLIASKRLRR